MDPVCPSKEVENRRETIRRFVLKSLKDLRHNCKYTYEAFYEEHEAIKKTLSSLQHTLLWLFDLIPPLHLLIISALATVVSWGFGLNLLAVAGGVGVASIAAFYISVVQCYSALQLGRKYHHVYNEAEQVQQRLVRDFLSGGSTVNEAQEYRRLMALKSAIDGTRKTDNAAYGRVCERLNATFENQDIESVTKTFT